MLTGDAIADIDNSADELAVMNTQLVTGNDI